MSQLNSPLRPAFSQSNAAKETSRLSQYEQQFWMLKAKRIESHNNELRLQNQQLNKRIKDLQMEEEKLKEKLQVYEEDWKNRSRKISAEKSEQTKKLGKYEQITPETVSQIQQLTTQLRIVKNLHEIQYAEIKEENKKLKREVMQLEADNQNSKQYVQSFKLLQKSKLDVESLKKKLSSEEDQNSRLRQQKEKILYEYECAKKQLVEIKIRQKVSKKQEEQKFFNYKQSYQDFTIQSQLKAIKGQQILTNISQQLQDRGETQRNQQTSTSDIQRMKRQIETLTNKVDQYERMLNLQKGSAQNQSIMLSIQVRKIENERDGLKQQLKRILTKLSPLLRTKRQSYKENVQNRSSLSLLEVFLKRYQILN